MASAPSTPSYARSTRASLSRSSPNSPKVPDSPTSTSSPKKLKRPSTLTGHDRQIALFMAQLRARGGSLSITAADPTQPCPLATLPTEIREMIYDYALPTFPLRISSRKRGMVQNKMLWPDLLRVSKCVRYEAAYMFYTRASFFAKVFDLKFLHVIEWIEALPVEHRDYLTRNQNLSIELYSTDLSESYIVVNKVLWEECRRFGNLYTVKHKDHFVALARLANWFLWCSKPIHNAITFNYTYLFDPTRSYWDRRDPWRSCSWAESAEGFLKHDLGSFLMPCSQYARLTRGQKGVMKTEALRMVECLDKGFQKANKVARENQLGWDKRMTLVKRHFEKW